MENEVRLIDGNRLVKCLKNKRLHILNENENNGAAVFADIIDLIEYEPEIYVLQKEADVAPVVHGKNITDMHPVDEFICSECGIDLTEFCRYDPEEDVAYEYEFKYCPNCGAKMDLEE